MPRIQGVQDVAPAVVPNLPAAQLLQAADATAVE